MTKNVILGKRRRQFEHKLTFSSNMIKSKGPRASGMDSLDSLYRKTQVKTPKSLLYLSQKQSYGQKCDFRETTAAILKMAANRQWDPKYLCWHHILLFSMVQGFKKNWSQTVMGEGVHGGPPWPMVWKESEAYLYQIYFDYILHDITNQRWPPMSREPLISI